MFCFYIDNTFKRKSLLTRINIKIKSSSIFTPYIYKLCKYISAVLRNSFISYLLLLKELSLIQYARICLPLNCSSHSLIEFISVVFRSLRSSYLSVAATTSNLASALLASRPPNAS